MKAPPKKTASMLRKEGVANARKQIATKKKEAKKEMDDHVSRSLPPVPDLRDRI